MVSAVLKRGAVTIGGAVPIRGNTVFDAQIFEGVKKIKMHFDAL